MLKITVHGTLQKYKPLFDAVLVPVFSMKLDFILNKDIIPSLKLWTSMLQQKPSVFNVELCKYPSK